MKSSFVEIDWKKKCFIVIALIAICLLVSKYLSQDVNVLRIQIPNLKVPETLKLNDDRLIFSHFELYEYVKSVDQPECINKLSDNFRFERLQEDKNFAIYIYNPRKNDCEREIIKNIQKLYEYKINDFKKRAIKAKEILKLSKNELTRTNLICFSSKFVETPMEDICTNILGKYHQYESFILEIDDVISIYDEYNFDKYIITNYKNINNINIFIFIFSLLLYLTYIFLNYKKKR